MRQGKGKLGDPILVALTLGKVGVEHTFLAVTAHAENLVVRGDARRHAIHDFAEKYVIQDITYEGIEKIYKEE